MYNIYNIYKFNYHEILKVPNMYKIYNIYKFRIS